MASLGYAATGFGQGMLQNRQLGRDESYRQQAMGLQERQLGLQEREMEDAKSRANRDFALRRIERLEGMLKDRRSLTPGQIEKMERELDKHYSSYPDLDMRAKDTPAAPPTTDATQEQPQAAPIPELYGLGQPPQPPPPPTNEMQLSEDLGRGPTQFDPMGIRPSMPDRPIPNTGVGVTGAQNPPVAGSFPANPFPPAPPARAPIAPSGGGGNQPFTGPVGVPGLLERMLAEAAHPDTPPAIRDQLLAQAVQLQQALAQTQGIGAQTDLTRTQTTEIPLEGASVRALRGEQIAASEAERKVFKPRELQLQERANELKRLAAMAELASQQRLAAKDAQELELSLNKYGLDVAQFMSLLEQRKLDAAKTGVDIKKALAEPDFWTKFAAEMAGKFAYGQTPYGKQFFPGPTAGILGSMVPGLGAGAGAGGGQFFDVEAYKRSTKDPPALQKQVIESMRKQGLIRP